jgi:hypothetical protein
MEGVQNTSIAIAILAFFLLLSNFYKMRIPMVSIKTSTWAWRTKFIKKILKSLRNMLKWWNFVRNLGGGSQMRGWCMDSTHAPKTPPSPPTADLVGSMLSLEPLGITVAPLPWHQVVPTTIGTSPSLTIEGGSQPLKPWPSKWPPISHYPKRGLRFVPTPPSSKPTLPKFCT